MFGGTSGKNYHTYKENFSMKTNYIETQKEAIQSFLQTSQYNIPFNKLRAEHKKSFLHMLLGVQEYLKKYYHFNVDWTNESEYIIPNITDEIFRGISENSSENNHYSDHYIDGLLFIDSNGELTSSEDANIMDIIVYQSKSGKSGELKKDFITFDHGIKFLFSESLSKEKNSNLDIFVNTNYALMTNNQIMVHPLYISLDKDSSKALDQELLTNTEILNNESVSDDLTELLLDKSSINSKKVNQTEEAKLKLTSVQNYSYPGSTINAYIAFAYLKDYLSFLNWHSNKSKYYTLDEGLFLRNVRRNVGKNTALNKTIRRTFLKGPNNTAGDIWWRSNGISIVADSMENDSNGTFTFKNPSIINGQQTSRQLANAYQENPEEFEKNNPSYSPWKFMIKIFIADTSNSETSNNIDAIISGLNSQSAINKNSIDLINRTTQKIADYVSDRRRNPPYLLELHSGIYTQDEFYKVHDQKNSIITIETLIQFALSAEIVKESSGEPIPIGKIRGSKNAVVKDYNKQIFTTVTNPEFWYVFIKCIKTFESNITYTSSDKALGLQYLTFALFKLAYKSCIKSVPSEPFFENGIKNFFTFLTAKEISSLKDKLIAQMKKEKNTNNNIIINWDQYSKTNAFEEMLNKIEL
jgi:hypothetical protein